MRFQHVPRNQQLKLATHVFVGVIEKQEIIKSRSFRITGLDESRPERRQYWKILKRRVRVEIVAKGVEPRKLVDIYEIYWTDGTTGDWNNTRENGRYIFPVRMESGYYHVVGDWWRSIYPVSSGRHSRLPLDNSRPLWERIALMNWWVQPGWSTGLALHWRNDPGNALGQWRELKILRGFLRHPNPKLRQLACLDLLLIGWEQDECWDALTPDERLHLSKDNPGLNPSLLSSEHIQDSHRDFEKFISGQWGAISTDPSRDTFRELTTVNDKRLRSKYCRLYEQQYPDDTNNGCPAEKPPPSTIVTEDGDVPLLASWPESDK